MNVSDITIAFGNEQRVHVRHAPRPGLPPFHIICANGRDLYVSSATELLAIYQAIGAALYGVHRVGQPAGVT